MFFSHFYYSKSITWFLHQQTSFKTSFKTNKWLLRGYWKLLVWRYWNILDPKKHRRKIDENHKDFWIIPSFHMSKNVLILPNLYWRHALKTFLPLLPAFPTILPYSHGFFTTSQLCTNFYQEKLVLFFLFIF